MQIFDIPINSKRMETTRIGTFDFPLAVHENDLKKNVLGFVNWHWHYEFQLTYVVRGTISVFFNQQTIDLHEGQGIYINPEVLHMIRDRYDSDAMFISLDVSPKLLTSFPNSVFERSYVKPVFCSSAADAVILNPGRGDEHRTGLQKSQLWLGTGCQQQPLRHLERVGLPFA